MSDRPLNRMISVFKDFDETTDNIVKPNLEAFAKIFLDELEQAYDALFDILKGYALDQAVGAQLDVLGRILDERREGLNDDEYRQILKLKTYIISSDGTVSKVTNCVAGLTGGTIIKWENNFPAGVNISTNGKKASPAILEKIKHVTAAAVLPDVTAIVGLPFGFSDESSSTPAAGSGIWLYDYEDVPDLTEQSGFADWDGSGTYDGRYQITVNPNAPAQNNYTYQFDLELKAKDTQETYGSTTISYTSSGAATINEIANGLVAAVQADAVIGGAAATVKVDAINAYNDCVIQVLDTSGDIAVITNVDSELAVHFQAGELVDRLLFEEV